MTASDRRTALLLFEEAERDKAFDRLQAERSKLADLKAELQRITGEMQHAISVQHQEVREAARVLADHEDAVKALTPRKPRRPRDVNTADPLMTGNDDDVDA